MNDIGIKRLNNKNPAIILFYHFEEICKNECRLFFRGGGGNIRWGIPLPGLTQVDALIDR